MDGTLINPTMLLAEGGKHEVGPLGFGFYLIVVIALMMGLMAYAKSGLNSPIYNRGEMSAMSNLGLMGRFKFWVLHSFEQLYLFIQNMTVGTIGSHGAKYTPMIMTIWMIVFVSNVLGLFAPATPTAMLSFNLGMALVSIGYVQYEGAKANGVVAHAMHFTGPKLGWALLPITLLIFVIEVVSELMKNLSLSLRLFGNIHGGHEAVIAMNKLGEPIFVPLGSFLLPIKLLTCLVQALIFSLLTCVYLSLVTGHHDDHAHEGDGGH